MGDRIVRGRMARVGIVRIRVVRIRGWLFVFVDRIRWLSREPPAGGPLAPVSEAEGLLPPIRIGIAFGVSGWRLVSELVNRLVSVSRRLALVWLSREPSAGGPLAPVSEAEGLLPPIRSWLNREPPAGGPLAPGRRPGASTPLLPPQAAGVWTT